MVILTETVSVFKLLGEHAGKTQTRLSPQAAQ
jgi:hypothetical protein